MNRRPSTVSMASSSSLPNTTRLSKSSSLTSPVPVSRTPSASWVQRSASISSTLANQAASAPHLLDPDELFAKHSVAEVRNVQLRLRADADAKQEELRIMVGERYRDLLQASSSIIAIARSSHRVQEALEEMHDAISGSNFEQQLPRRSGTGMKEGAYSHLKTLQSLAAHMKLLLDTPEHLWRLIERKKYLHAGWLFMLARVIHHALVQPAIEGDEEDWKTHNIDVQEQFPIVQRQWETVGQFKSQIAYKATLSLREPRISVEDICSVLLTLHLLDSEPLTKTVNIFFLQRSRSLQHSLTRAAPISSQAPQHVNGSALKARKAILRDVRDSLDLVLNVIALTVGAARRIFNDSPSSPSLMTRVLTFIEIPQSSDFALPAELQMSTQKLLSNLPSASHFTLLPLSIRSYKPYVDLDSPATVVVPAYLTERLSQWFQQATTDLKRAAGGWFADVDTLTDLWELRRWTHLWAKTDTQLVQSEIETILDTVDAVVRIQAAELWKARLGDMETAVGALVDRAEESLLEVSHVNFLFQAPPHVPTFKLGGVSMAASFQKYGDALRSQIAGRTPLLDKVLSTVESRSAALRQDLGSMISDGEGGCGLLDMYRPDADEFLAAVLEAMSSSSEKFGDDAESTMRALAFLSRLAHELSSSSFLADVRHGTGAGMGFENKAQELHGRTLERWRQLTCAGVTGKYIETWSTASDISRPSKEISSVTSSPSSALMQALFSLATACQSVDTPMHLAHAGGAVLTSFRLFVRSLLDSLQQRDIASAHRHPLLWDLRLLRRITLLWDSGWELAALDERIAELESKAGVDSASSLLDPDTVVSDHLARTHVLLAALLPSTYTPASAGKPGKKDSLPNGFLLPDSNPQPTMELVKPGPRFGLLLVESTAVG
ncbi:hypothetical protein K488DRAFT_79063 [Vararia minispora EC-137]|uniref:Uncharacterized protein n=1 Tax=Vararia minispora EC-137 TaxID=1314806 RepID=A0ACB8QI83_9AGAM|nr:hypothetical protein K488DRAFT_79063 [Vararia minispora EC-137]